MSNQTCPFFLLVPPLEICQQQFLRNFSLSFKIPSSFYQGCDISSGCHQVVKIHKVFIKFSPGFHEAFSKSFHQAALGFQTDFDRFFDQVFTRFWKFTRFSPSFHPVFTRFSPGFHQVFKIHQVFTKFSPSFHQVFTKFSASFRQAFTKFSLGFHQVFTEFSPGFHQVFTRFSPGVHLVLKIHQVFTRFWKFTKFSPGFGPMRFSIHFHHENT